MLSLLIRPLRLAVQALLAGDSSRQIAWGVALGMLAGLIPKGNLLAVVFGISVFALRVNLSAALISASVFSALGIAIDGFAHRIGSLILTWPTARPYFAELYQLPLGPYLGVNNTVVLGQLLVGLYCLYPAYYAAFRLVERYRPPLERWLSRYRIVAWLRGADAGINWGIEA